MITGDLNAIAKHEGIMPLCYRSIKDHNLGLRSLLNDDVIPEAFTGGEVQFIFSFFLVLYSFNNYCLSRYIRHGKHDENHQGKRERKALERKMQVPMMMMLMID